MYTEYRVGEPLPGTRELPYNSAIFDFSTEGGTLYIAYERPTEIEIMNFRKGKASLGLVEVNGIIFILAKYGDQDWLDVPYHVNFSREFKLPLLEDATLGYPILTIFLDSKDRVIKAIRLFAMPHEMSLNFNIMVEKQRNTSIEDFDAMLDMIYKEYTTADLVKKAKIYKLPGK
jgi:hypothetical protein